MEKQELLQSFGLSDKESATYLAILELGTSTIQPIAERAGVKRTSIYNFIDNLVSQGLITRAVLRGRNHYRAVSPSRLIELQKERLRLLEQSLPEFMSMFNLSSDKPRISYFSGPSQMKNIMREEPLCVKEVCYIWPGKETMEMIGGVKFMSEIDRQRIDAGVWVRSIRFRRKDVVFRTSASGPQFLRELRFAPPDLDISMGMGIYDTGKVSFVSSRKEGFGILIESRELAELMKVMWNLLWQRCEVAKRGEG